ncbi:hypothetical protein TcWFU_002999 [Taenia crassiceps]|uniref:RRM domain-containing protein n=1 Tax=Taenia crassiceps TaxID=6207 RepID=A0ABR4Q1F4_9CEST
MADLVCGVCKKWMSNPYSLPCGHTFCLRPCLLSNASATKSRCIHCSTTFDVAELCPNYAVLMRLNQLSWQQQQQHNPNQNQKEGQKQASRQDQALNHLVEDDGSDQPISLYRKISFVEEVNDRDENVRQDSCQNKDEEDDSVIRDVAASKQIFISGIPAMTNCEELRDYFSRYGTVKDCNVSRHKSFGSLTFESEEAVHKAISQPIQIIGGARVKVKEYIATNKQGTSRRPSSRETANSSSSKFSSRPPFESPNVSAPVPESSLKERQGVFIGGISRTMTVDTLKTALSKLGPVKKVNVNTKRGFAVAVFERPETAKLAISMHWHIIDDSMVEIQPFLPNKMTKKPANNQKNSYGIGAQQFLHSLRLEQVQEQKREKQKLKTSMNTKWTREKSLLSTPCSTCQTPVGVELLNFCHHCCLEVCPQCHENHRSNYVLMLQAKLRDLSRQSAFLKSKSPTLKTEKKAKDKIIEALDNAVLQLYLATNKGLDSAMAKLETIHKANEPTISRLSKRISDLSDGLDIIKDVYPSMEAITDLHDAMEKRKLLEKLILKVAQLKSIIANLPPPLITQMRVSDLPTEIHTHMSDFDLVLLDYSVLPPQLPFSYIVGDKSS